MANPYYHALSSSRKFGGVPGNYLALHEWMDASKAFMCDPRHRALRHHTEGIAMMVTIFGSTITNSDGKVVPVRSIGEQHVLEDCGFIPKVTDWLEAIQIQPWMLKVGRKGAELEKEALEARHPQPEEVLCSSNSISEPGD